MPSFRICIGITPGTGKGVHVMTDFSDVCTCGMSRSAEEDCPGGLCPVCGKRMKRMEELSDSLIDATFEVLAEEGAVRSGAR